MIQKQLLISILQKSCLRSNRSQMFFKIGFLKKFCNNYRKTTVLEALKKVAALKVCKETPEQVLSCKYCETLIEHLFLQNTSIDCFCCFKKFVNFPVKHQWRRPNTFIFLINTTE